MMSTRAAEGEESSPTGRRPTLAATQPVASQPAAHQDLDKPPSDRLVTRRTQFCVSFSPASGPSASMQIESTAALPDLRGWSSPHGEPYRPLGKPELSLKFTPRLADGSSLLQNAQRMRVFEGAKPLHTGTSSGQGGALSKATEARKAAGTGASESAAQDKPSPLSELFPLFNLGSKRQRSLDERQVKLAYRLQASVASYSPDKIQSLQRRPGAPHRHSPTRVSRQDAQRLGAGAGGDAFATLKDALHECSSRLRLVRNGASLLRQFPTEGLPELRELETEYLRSRALGLEEGRAVSTSTNQRGGVRHEWPSRTLAEDATSIVAASALSSSDEDKGYLPYTTRQCQLSPHRHLPSLDEVRVKVRQEKQQLPVRPLRTSHDAASGQQPLPSTPRRPSRRPSRFNSTVISAGGRLSLAGQTHELASPATRRPSQSGDVQGHVGAATAHRPSHGARHGVPGPNDGRVGRAQDASALGSSPTKLHSVERLQAAVGAMEAVKATQAAQLAQSIALLDHDRRDCLALKFQSFHVERHVDDDLAAMRARSERHRVRLMEQAVESFHWYEELLRNVLAREGTGPPPHPAELFLVQAIRRLAHEGRELTVPLLFELLQRVHVEDLEASAVQDVLLYLRGVVAAPPDAWAAFFRDRGVHAPVEASERKEAPANEHRLSRISSKLRAVVKVSQLLRHASAKR